MNTCLFSNSFLSATGTGFEAFFTPNGHLVVAIVTKKEYVTAPLVEVVLADDLWVGSSFFYTTNFSLTNFMCQMFFNHLN